MRFTYKGQRIELQGLKDDTSHCAEISPRRLHGLFRHQAVAHCIQFQMIQETVPAESSSPITDFVSSLQDYDFSGLPQQIASLIKEFSHLFEEPTSLPPKRSDDHQIPLLPGAQPVQVRPYRYSPAQKDEIEHQLQTMLKSGIIKPSVSPYASPVLLVKKKDGTWRFCIDYRHLNAITVKNKHPMPIVEELFDELTRACWFTKLDFRLGYHQVRMAAEDQAKTAFRTHNGLFEFLVMPFGLTNALATFQSLMNKIFAHLLRKGVLVFMDDILIYSKTLEEHNALLKQVFEILHHHRFSSNCPSVHLHKHPLSIWDM